MKPRLSIHDSWALTTMSLTGLGLALIVAAAYLWFGSMNSALAYISGERLFVESPKVALGTIDPGEARQIPYILSNFLPRKVKVLGASSSCSCTVVEGLPMSIPPSSRRVLTIRFTAKPDRIGELAETVRIYTDESAHPEIRLLLTACVRDQGLTSPALGPVGEAK